VGREVRRVSKDWEHPKKDGEYIPLFDGPYSYSVRRFDSEEIFSLEGWFTGGRPKRVDFMPDWSEDEKTHYQMYEFRSKGTPVSPVMETPELLANWMTNDSKNNADSQESYEVWLRVCNGVPMFNRLGP